ncbi:DNA replication protein DnaD [Clostridiales bacterium CHKCI006]|uniref:DnaD domain protein n=1 Tax=Candidatus Fimiplasma intestinipullorum TaxID=2840825 RepID=A0A9D1HMJ9_9FIRM|nr:DNA replication protein DnaD [Clostridiales bacterium CHKCI006]HIU13290.1 DnaD domain protein [Candidatus Fimiplasma intestinipullorum]
MDDVLAKLVEHQAIDFEKLLLLSYRNLDMTEAEVVILMLVLHLEKMGEEAINPVSLSRYMSLPLKEIDQLVMKLVNRKILSIEQSTLSALPLIKKLLTSQQEQSLQVTQQQKQKSLVAMFEHEFGRALTPIELETIREWKQVGYSDEMIYEALKEATLSHVHNMRYINKILIDWAKHGIKRSGREKIERQDPVVEIVDYPWWEEE